MGFKVGDIIYCESFHSYTVGVITEELKKTFRVSFSDKRTVKIDIRGYQIGSRGDGRYGSFSSVYWRLLTNDVRLKIEAKKTIYKLKNLSFDVLEKAINSDENKIDALKTIYNTINTLMTA